LNQRVAIDVYPMAAGKGGTGGGVWRYAERLLRNLDHLVGEDGPELLVYASKAQGLKYNNIEVREIGDGFSSKSGRFLWVHWTLPRMCRRDKVTVLHKLATEVPLDQRGIAVVATIHDFMSEFQLEQRQGGGRSLTDRLRQLYFSALASFALRTTRASIFPTQSVRDEARRRYQLADDSSLVVVPNGVDQEPASQTSADTPAVFTWIVVASFSAHKGHLQVVAGLRKLGERLAAGESVRVVFRGHVVDKSYYELVRRACADLPRSVLLEFVEFDSSASDEQVYSGVSGLILLSEYEGFGLPPIEAQARGIPVIVSDIAVFRETLKSDALYVRADDADAVASAMYSVMHDDELRRELATRGLHNAAEYAWSRTAAETLDVYRTVLALQGSIK
jgi:glycosyltransferase involved in cell wall biosynthesis